MGHFPGDDREFGKWTVDVLKDYLETPITESPDLVETEAPVSPTQVNQNDERFASDLPAKASKLPTSPNTDPPTLEDADVLTESNTDIDIEIEAEIRTLLEQISTEASFEKILRDNFSTQQCVP